MTFCRKTSNVWWRSFVDQIHPHHMLGSKVTWVTTASYCYTILGNVFLLNGRQQWKAPTFCKGLNISRMQAVVRLPTEFDNLLLNAAGYFDVYTYFTHQLQQPLLLIFFTSFKVLQWITAFAHKAKRNVELWAKSA